MSLDLTDQRTACVEVELDPLTAEDDGRSFGAVVRRLELRASEKTVRPFGRDRKDREDGSVMSKAFLAKERGTVHPLRHRRSQVIENRRSHIRKLYVPTLGSRVGPAGKADHQRDTIDGRPSLAVVGADDDDGPVQLSSRLQTFVDRPEPGVRHTKRSVIVIRGHDSVVSVIQVDVRKPWARRGI